MTAATLPLRQPGLTNMTQRTCGPAFVVLSILMMIAGGTLSYTLLYAAELGLRKRFARFPPVVVAHRPFANWPWSGSESCSAVEHPSDTYAKFT
jgi:hypothetical protein